jgi:hypothetical protein
MCISIFYAQIFGIYLVVSTLAFLYNAERAKKFLNTLTSFPALITFSGAISLLLGSAVIITHNFWIACWPVVITLFGWFLAVTGSVRLFFPSWVENRIKAIVARDLFPLICCFWLAFGLFLLWAGFAK